MMDKNKKIRNHPLTILEGLFGMMWIILVFIFSFIGSISEIDGTEILSDGMIIIIAIGGIAAILALSLLILFIRWRKCYIYIDGNEIVLEKGAIFKRKLVMPFEKINTININRSIIQRIFGLCRLSFDTGSIVAREAGVPELSITLKLDSAEKLKAYISAKMKNEDAVLNTTGDIQVESEEKKKLYRISIADYFIYGLTTSKIGWLIVAVLGIIGEVGDFVIELMDEVVLPTLSKIDPTVLIVAGIIAFAMAYLLVAVISVIVSLIRFHSFTVTRDGNNINIKYGLLTIKNFTLPVRNIHALIIKQNLVRQIFGLCSVEAVSIGYGDGENEVALLIPIIKKSKLKGVLRELLPEYSIDTKTEKAPKRALLWFVLKPMLVPAISVAVAYFIINSITGISPYAIPIVIAMIIVELFAIIAGSLHFCHSELGFDERSVKISSGGFHRTVTIMRRECVQSVDAESGLIQRWFKLSDYILDYHAPALKSSVRVNNLADGYEEQIADLIEK